MLTPLTFSQILDPWGYLIIFLASILEAVPLLGLFIPGGTIVILGGFFSRLHDLSFWKVALLASLGAIMGDYIGYVIGRKYGHPFLTKYGKYFMFKEKYYQKTRKMIQSHAGKSLILGRFNSLSRSFSPFVAGSSEIPFLKFSFYNLLGGLCWGFSFVLLGFLFGKSYKLASRSVTGLFLFIILVIAIIIYLNYRKRKQKEKL